MTWAALLLLRVVTGGLLIGHGAQKLVGAFGGKGPEGTGQAFERLGLQPGREWAEVAGASEVAGGSLIATAPMVVARRKAHGGKPIWSNQGGGELPVTNLTIAAALMVAGPGPISIDRLFGIKTPWWMSLLAISGTAAGIAIALGDEIHEAAETVRREEAVVPTPRSEGLSAPAR